MDDSLETKAARAGELSQQKVADYDEDTFLADLREAGSGSREIPKLSPEDRLLIQGIDNQCAQTRRRNLELLAVESWEERMARNLREITAGPGNPRWTKEGEDEFLRLYAKAMRGSTSSTEAPAGVGFQDHRQQEAMGDFAKEDDSTAEGKADVAMALATSDEEPVQSSSCA